ncbi:MAG: DUF5683 domain-containing protein [Spirosomataceae bacterium]
MKKIGVLLGLWLIGSVTVVEAQQTKTDSLQKRLIRMTRSADSLRLDSLGLNKSFKDSLEKSTLKLPKVKHSPKKAAYYSLMLPGLGQAYNKQYWKMPFVYAGFGTVGYFIRYFNVRYQDFLTPYIASYDATSGKQLRSEAVVYIRSQKQSRTLTLDQITKGKDLYRRYRDLNIVLLAGAWALTAVEANVAAHLKTFDMSDDISLRFLPDAGYSPFTGGVVGAKVVIGWK